MSDFVTDRAPDVDDPDPRLEEAVCIFAEVQVHSSDTGGECLVDVDTLLVTYILISGFGINSHLLTSGLLVRGVFSS
jgi:hypothetical protein